MAGDCYRTVTLRNSTTQRKSVRGIIRTPPEIAAHDVTAPHRPSSRPPMRWIESWRPQHVSAMVDGSRGVGMLSLPLLLGVIGAALVVWFWQNSLGARERANRAAFDACTRMQLQFLDGTVAFARLGLARNDRGKLCLRRTYIFDYTATSIERRQGFVVLLGTRVESIGFAPDDQQRHSVTPLPDGTDKSSAIDHDTSNVLDLEEWRRRHQRKPPPTRSSSPNDNAPSDNGW